MSTLQGDIKKTPFGMIAGGIPVDLYTLRNGNGMEARITNYGGTITSLTAPDRNGRFEDVVLGCDTLDGYFKGTAYLGCIAGRCANRIAKGKFSLNGVSHQLAVNNPPNLLHGGLRGFDKVVWQAVPSATPAGPALELSYLSKDGEEGFPGNLRTKALHTLTSDNALRIDFTATTDMDTIVNLTNHSYFNLAGKGDILGHLMQINGDNITPVDATLIPTGEWMPVAGTPFDFRKPARIGARIDEPHAQIKIGGGYDHNWVLNKPPGKLEVIACVTEPLSGRVLEVSSTQPAVQFYSANYLDGTITGKGGARYQRRAAFCLEPQHFPDAINHPNFPSVVLKAGETYRQSIIFLFSTEK